jgi:hypothetical protein
MVKRGNTRSGRRVPYNSLVEETQSILNTPPVAPEPILQREARDSAQRWLARFSPLLDEPETMRADECRRRLERLQGLRSDSQQVLFSLQSQAGTDYVELLTTLRQAVDELDERESELRRRIAALAPGDAEGEVDLQQIRSRIAQAEARREVEQVTGSRLETPSRFEIMTSPGNLAGGAFMGIFCLGWMSFTTLHAAMMIWEMGHSSIGWGALFMLLFYAIFWAAGFGIGAGAWKTASKEHATFDGRTLTVTHALFGKEWKKSYELATDAQAYVTQANFKQNNVPSWELALTDADGKEIRLGSGRQMFELQQKAEKINAFLREPG